MQVTVPVNENGEFDVEFDLTGLSNGANTLTITSTDLAGNVSNQDINVNIGVVDITPPTAAITSNLIDTPSSFNVTYNEAVSDEAFAAGNYTLTISGGDNDGQTVEVSSVEKVSNTVARLTLAAPLTQTSYQLALGTEIKDLAGNAIAENTTLDLSIAPPSVTISPSNGEEMVALTRETIVRFNTKIDPSTVNDESFYVIANGERLEGRIAVSSTEEFATFFYDKPLPQSTEVRVVVDGDKIKSRSGVAIDGNSDGIAGGIATADFTTLPLTRIEGTDVWGYVYDSYNKNEDGSDIPLEGVVIRLDSLPDVFAVTDENGYFKLEDVPAPDFYVYIDGSNVENAPEDTQYASLGKPFHSVPGQEVQLEMDGEAFDVYLPPMAKNDIKQLSTTEDTEVGFGETSQEFLEQEFPDVDPEDWKQVKVTFPAGSAQDDQGNPATQAMIVPVDPNRLPAPLPPNLDPKLVISIQAGNENGFNRETDSGATNFDVPAPVQFPNLDNLPPGEKATIWSFNHDAGRFEAIGLGTVSEDGKTIISDPGVGIQAPGWHFSSPPLNWTGSGGPPEGNKPVDEESDPEISQMLHSTSGGNELSFTFTPPPGPRKQPGEHELPQGEKEPTRVITMTVEGQFSDYYKADEGGGVRSHTWTLKPGDSSLTVSSIQKNLTELKNDLNSGKLFEENILYGSKIKVEEVLTLADGSRQKSTRIIFPYMLIGATDPGKEDLKLQFAQTINDGKAKVTRDLPLKIKASGSSKPNLSLTNSSHYSLNNSSQEVRFDPTGEGNSLTSAIEVKNPLDNNLAGKINLEGKGVKKQGWQFDKASFETIAKAIADDTTATKFPTVTATQRALMDTKAERDAILASISSQTATLFQRAGLTPGIFESASAGNNVLNISFIEGANPAPGRGWGLGGATGALTPANVGLANIVAVYTNRTNYSQLERGYRAAEQVNNQLGGNIEFKYDNFFEAISNFDTTNELKFAFGHNNAHEIGHHLGLFHTGTSSTVKLAGGSNDVMRQGLYMTDSKNFNITKEAAKLGLHIDWTGSEADKAIAYYNAYQAAGGNFNSENSFGEGADDDIGPGLDLFPNPLLGLFSEDENLIASTFDLGTILADGEGGEAINTFWSLSNLGPDNLTLTEVSFSENNSVIQLTPNLTGTVLNQTNGIAQLDISFDPTEAGEFNRDVSIIADNGEEYTITVTGTAIDPNPVFDISILNENNNLTGVAVGETKTNEQLLTITNKGAAELTFTPTLVEGNLDFDLGTFTGVEQTLAFGESLIIPVTFNPTKTGLLPGSIQFTTNDPDLATFNQGIVGTGIPDGQIEFDWGNDFVVVEYNDFVQRTTSNDAGDFMFEIPTFTEYNISIFDPDSGLIATGGGFTGAAGAFTDLTTSLAFLPSNTKDTDFDGLPDDIEFTIGTDITKIDTDGDQLSDFAEIEQGLDPLGGRGFPTGIISSLPLRGEAKAIVLEGSTQNSQGQTAYIATGSYGLAIVDTSDFDNPIILGQLNLPGGDATDVAVDINLQVAAVATNTGALKLVDVSDPMLPKVEQTINIPANQVEIVNGIAYATVGTLMYAIDLVTGEELQQLNLGGSGTVTGMAREGEKLYTYVSGSDTFSVIDISNETQANILGQLRVSVASRDVGVFAANGVAYLAGSGLRTIDVSDPTNPTLISNAENFFTARDLELNGSGLALVATENQGVGIYDINDPTNTNNFITQIDTSGFTYDVAIASGIAYIADGSGGLKVINYLPFDAAGEAPTNVNINSLVTDTDPETPGIQVVEGSTLSFTTAVEDDVQVRNVELLFNGEVVQNDLSFPFDLSGIAPNITPDNNQLEVQVRATDTGGNSTLSEILTFDLLPDTFAPEVANSNPENNGVGENVKAISIRFNENIDTSRINLSGITLTSLGADGTIGDGDDSAVALAAVETPSNRRLVVLLEESLPIGKYQLTLDPSIIADNAGNSLESPLTLEFTATKTLAFSRTDFPVGEKPSSMTGADFDDDGDIDLAVAHPGRINSNSFNGNTVSIVFNNGEGSFSEPVDLTTEVGPQVQSGDFNGDGNIDLAVNSLENDNLAIFLNNGNGEFTQSGIFDTGERPVTIPPADLDGDGDLDLVVLNTIAVNNSTAFNDGDTISVLLNDGNAGFATSVTYTLSRGIESAAIGDLDNDGDIDLAVVNRRNDSISLLFNDGNGNFDTSTTLNSVSPDPIKVTLADFNSDGNLDLITNSFTSSGRIYVFLSNGDGTFAQRASYNTPGYPNNLNAFDFDLDGDLDIGTNHAVVFLGPERTEGNRFSVLRNNGDGTFTSPITVEVGNFPVSPVVADLDGDGDVDTVTSNGDDDTISVLKNEII